MNVGGIIHGYTVTGVSNGYIIGRSDTKPNPYVVWKIDHDGKDVCCGHYFNDREEAEWDFCARAFEWFEDNMNVHMIEDSEQPLEQRIIRGFKKIKEGLAAAAQLVDEMCEIVNSLKSERRCLNDRFTN